MSPGLGHNALDEQLDVLIGHRPLLSLYGVGDLIS